MRLINFLKAAYISIAQKDDKRFPQSQVSHQGAAKDAIIIYPYGFHASAPVNTPVILVSLQENEDNPVAFTFNEDGRPKNLEEDEAIMGNFVIGSTIHFKKNGDIVVTCQNNEQVDIVGNCTVNIGGNAVIDVDGNATVDVGGTLQITSVGIMDITAPTINLNGIVNISGVTTLSSTLNVSGSSTLAGVTSNGKNIGSTHLHSGVTTGVGTSGPPV